MNEQIVSITSRGQLTLPKALRDMFDVQGASKATVTKVDDTIVVRPLRNFSALAGSLRSPVTLNKKELQNARKAFSKQWARK